MIIPKFIYERMIEIEKEKAYKEGFRAFAKSFEWQIAGLPTDIKEVLSKMVYDTLKSFDVFEDRGIKRR